MRSSRLLIGGTLLTLVLAACGGSTPSTNPSTPAPNVGIAGGNLGTATVMIAATDHFTFDPAMQTANAGEIIQLTNTGSALHTITFDSEPSLSDPALEPGGVWQVNFTTAGTYPYHCTVYPGMVGTIIVN